MIFNLVIKYEVPLCKCPDYIKNIEIQYGYYFTGSYDLNVFQSILNDLDIGINDLCGKYIIRKIHDNSMDIFSLSDKKKLATIYFVPVGWQDFIKKKGLK